METSTREVTSWWESAYLVSSDNRLEILNDFVACCRIKSTSWLIQEQDFWSCDELAGNRKTSLLAP